VCALYLDRFITLRRIKALTGVRVRRQQHWLALARLLGTAALCAALAWAAVHGLLESDRIIVRLIGGASVLGGLYLVLTWRRYVAPALR
jgi:hypothetical protein